jgi:hypothetical protein
MSAANNAGDGSTRFCAVEILEMAGCQRRETPNSLVSSEFPLQFAEQRIVMREELKRAFLDNDVRELVVLASRYQLALVNNPRHELRYFTTLRTKLMRVPHSRPAQHAC